MTAARLLLSVLALASLSKGSWLYLTSFQSGTLIVWDAEREKEVRRLPIEDRAGAVGIAVSPDGARLFIADGGRQGRLRVVNARTGSQLVEVALADRRLSPGADETVWLTGDGRWLLAGTYDYYAAAAGVRIFDARDGVFLPVGLRYRPCPAPQLAPARGSLLFLLCPGLLATMEQPPNPTGDFSVRSKVPTPLEHGRVAAAAGVSLSAGCPETGTCSAEVWSAGEPRTRGIQLQVPPAGGRSLAVAVSRDGALGAVVLDRTLLFVDLKSAQVERRVELPGESEGSAFSPDGRVFWTMAAGEATLHRVDAEKGPVRSVRLPGAPRPAGPWKLIAAPEPTSAR